MGQCTDRFCRFIVFICVHLFFEDSATQHCRSERAESLAEAKFYTVRSQNNLRTKRRDSLFKVHTVVRTHQCNSSKGVQEMLMRQRTSE